MEILPASLLVIGASIKTAPVNEVLANNAGIPLIDAKPESILPALIALNPPATIVTLGQIVEPPQVYTEPVTVNLLRDKRYAGPAAVATSQALMQSFTQLSEKKTTFSVSSLFSKVGALSRETSEYRNEVRKFHVPHNIPIEKFTPTFSGSSGARVESVFLTIKTKDGDSIDIQISRNAAGRETTQLAFSFVVDGELSDKEQKALENLTTKLGGMGDEFFRMDTTELRGLDDVDTDAIRSFKFTLQRPDPANDTYVEHTYEFSVDEITRTQSLVATDVRGYSVDIKSQLQTLAKDNALNMELLQQYLDLIIKATDDSHTPNTSKRFMLDAFESMFSGFIALANVTQDQEGDSAERALAAFDSGMPDFKATFRSPEFHNPNYYAQAESMVLTIEQSTSVEENGNSLLIKQQSSYEFINHYFDNFPVEKREDFEDFGGYYTYTTEHESGSIGRFLSMTNDVVNNIWIEQDVTMDVRKTRFENYKVANDESFTYADRRIQEFSELLKKYNSNNQQSAVEALLQSSKEKLFLAI